jgi:hypothetical protein
MRKNRMETRSNIQTGGTGVNVMKHERTVGKESD